MRVEQSLHELILLNNPVLQTQPKQNQRHLLHASGTAASPGLVDWGRAGLMLFQAENVALRCNFLSAVPTW